MRNASGQGGMDRRAFVARLVSRLPDALIVTGLGSASYDVYAAGDRDLNYYLWGAMGGAAALGLGLALAQPERKVIVITGDGEMLMGIGSLGTIGVKQPGNLSVVVLDNGHYGETGMQRSHASLGTDLVAVAKGFGISQARSISSLQACDDLARRINARRATVFARVLVAAIDVPKALPPRDGPFIKNRLRSALGLSPF